MAEFYLRDRCFFESLKCKFYAFLIPYYIARLTALVPKPRINLTRYHGVLAPNSPQRGEVTPGKRGKRAGVQSTDEANAEIERRVFKIDIETCEECGGAVTDAHIKY